MAKPLSFPELVEAIAQQQRAAGQARQHPVPGAEKPKEAILDALSMVADAIAADGYVFLRSGPRFARKCNDFTFVISIHSDHNNVAGQRAAISAYALVYSKELGAWRKKHSSSWIRLDATPLFTRQLGYLCKPPGWMEWDFANKAERSAIVEDFTATIRAGAFPLFSIFEGPVEGFAATEDNNQAPPEALLGYLLAIGRVELARKTLSRRLDRKAEFRTQFEKLFHQFSEQGLPPHLASDAHNLAVFAVATGYPWLADDSIARG